MKNDTIDFDNFRITTGPDTSIDFDDFRTTFTEFDLNYTFLEDISTTIAGLELFTEQSEQSFPVAVSSAIIPANSIDFDSFRTTLTEIDFIESILQIEIATQQLDQSALIEQFMDFSIFPDFSFS